MAASETPSPEREVTPDQVDRVEVDDARRRVQSGEALLVCAYPSEERFQQVALEGAISSGSFEERLAELPRTQEIIFYCS